MAATEKFARGLAEKISGKKPGKKAVIVALAGELGAGKTAFAKGFASGLGVNGRIFSPTFILMRKAGVKNKKFRDFFHIDAYRATDKNFLKLGIREIAEDPRNIILIEWADKLKRILPKSAIWIKFEHGKGENERIVTVNKEL